MCVRMYGMYVMYACGVCYVCYVCYVCSLCVYMFVSMCGCMLLTLCKIRVRACMSECYVMDVCYAR